MKQKIPLTAHLVKGRVFIDEKPAVEWFRARKWAGHVAYAAPYLSDQDLSSLCRHPEDVAFGRPGRIEGVSLRTAGRGRFRVLRGDCWGCVTDDPGHEVSIIAKTCDELGLPFATSAAGTAAAIIKEHSPWPVPTPERWRAIGHGAVAAGPMLHCRGGAPDAIHIDRNAAFLHAMTKPLPNPLGGWYECQESDDWHVVSGFALVPETLDAVAPLPANVRGVGVVYPVGVVRGTWTREVWDVAAEYGAELLPGCRFARHSMLTPWLAEIAEQLWKMRDDGDLPRRVSKAIYTRIWGKMASRGSWEGHPGESGSEITAYPYAGLYWVSRQREATDIVYTRSYMPDVAAFITSYNHAVMMKHLMAMGPAVIASHVDAIWYDSRFMHHVPTGESLGEFSLVGRGALHYMRQGTYISDWKIGAMGYPKGWRRTPASIRRWVQSTPEALESTHRVWDKDPQRHQNAISWTPKVHHTRQWFFPGAGPDAATWHESIWSLPIDERRGAVTDLNYQAEKAYNEEA